VSVADQVRRAGKVTRVPTKPVPAARKK